MLLTHAFPDPQLNLTLELLLRIIREELRECLVSVVLHGSVVFDDLAPGYGDLDFLVIVGGDLPDSTCSKLVGLRKPLRSGKYGVLASMLEGAFLPQSMLDPAIKGRAFWWGTSGERRWSVNQLSWLVLHVIRERGVVIWGQDIRPRIPPAPRVAMLGELADFAANARKHAVGGDIHQVDWLLTAARLLLWLREGRLSSKSEAADWGCRNATGRWRELLPKAKELRLYPLMAGSAEVKRWLAGLASPIQEAANEVAGELRAQGGPGPGIGKTDGQGRRHHRRPASA